MFQSFFIGGFECSTHRLPPLWSMYVNYPLVRPWLCRFSRRLDLITSTAHDKHLISDYARLQAQGIYTVREGLRWHLIEKSPGQYDFSSILPFVRASRDMNMQVIWDICHYGWPSDLNIFSSEFVRRFGRFARAFARLLRDETDTVPLVTPVNEISFFSWAGAGVGYFYPYKKRRGDELKAQLVRAAIEGSEAVWDIDPGTRIIHIDPLINVVADPSRPHEREAAEEYRCAQFHAWDMLSGRMCPELGGDDRYLDIIGVNFYDRNQSIYEGPENYGPNIFRTHPLYRPFRYMLQEVYERYGRPLFIAETGAEDQRRSTWLSYVGEETRAAMSMGVPVGGMCLYPIVNFPGWDNDRHCHNGLWDYADESGEREIYQPLARELKRQSELFARHMRHPVEQQHPGVTAMRNMEELVSMPPPAFDVPLAESV